jgi:hypothetical protein
MDKTVSSHQTKPGKEEITQKTKELGAPILEDNTNDKNRAK